MRIFLGHSSKNKTVKRFVYTSEIQSSQAVALCSLPDGSDFFFLFHLPIMQNTLSHLELNTVMSLPFRHWMCISCQKENFEKSNCFGLVVCCLGFFSFTSNS